MDSVSTPGLTAAQRVIAEKTVCVLLVRGTSPEGESVFAYIAIRADKLPAFLEAQSAGTFFPEDFGIVLESGSGEPSIATREKMTKEYGFNHDAMVDLKEPADAYNLSSNLLSAVKKQDNS